MKVIVPCCGSSSRFPNLPPKWMLPDHAGRPMICEAVAKLEFQPADLVVSVLREHEQRFDVTAGLEAAFGFPVNVVVLEEKTRSQSETVAKTVTQLGLEGPFLVKDSDNCFAIRDLEQPYNYVCFDSLNNHDLINPKNKSYLQMDTQGVIVNIREKMVISDTFSVGGYYFADAATFLRYYNTLSTRAPQWEKELYLSDIIGSMLLDGQPFQGRPVSNYQDWGTIHDWKRTLLRRKGYFILLDGFLFERGSEHFSPRYGSVRPIEAAVAAVKKLRAQGHNIILLSTRPQRLASMTRDQLAGVELADLPVTYDCPVSRWELITAPYHGIPFRTSEAYELEPGAEGLIEKLSQ